MPFSVLLKPATTIQEGTLREDDVMIFFMTNRKSSSLKLNDRLIRRLYPVREIEQGT